MVRIAALILLALMPGLSPAITADRCDAIFEASRQCRWPMVNGSNVKFCDRINPKEAACSAKRQAAWDADAALNDDLTKPCRGDGATFGCRTEKPK